MAAVAPSPLASSTEKTNGAKLSRLLIDGGTTVLRSVFDSFHPPANLVADLNASKPKLITLLRKKVLNKPQWDKLFPPGGAAPDSNSFDITLLFLLLTNICGLSPPPTGWHSKPPPSDISREANLSRVKFFRNQLYGHVAATGVDTASFNALWLEISGVLVALGLGQAEIDRLKAERCGEEDYLDALHDWAESEEDIKSQLKDIRQSQLTTQQTVEENKSKLEEVHQIEKETHKIVTEDHDRIQNSISKLEVIHQAQMDTNRTVKELHQVHHEDYKTLEDNKRKLEKLSEAHVETRQTVAKVLKTQEEHTETLQGLQRTFEDSKGGESNQEDEILKKLAKVDTQNDVKYYAERYLEGTRESIFAKVEGWLDNRSSPNRVMVISATPGMGKSVIAAVMCKRMKEVGRLSGSHFCHYDKARHRNPKVMLQSLACHLSNCLPEYKKALVEQLSRNLGVEINSMGVGELFEFLFEEPLSRLSDPGFTSLVVIDALDESEYQGRNELSDVVGKYFSKLPLWVRFLVTTRPEMNIWKSLQNLQPLQLEPNSEENLKDIRLYFQQRLIGVLEAESREMILNGLVQKSEGVILGAQFLVDSIKNNLSTLTLEQLDSTLPTGISFVYQSYFKRLETELIQELKLTEDQFFSFLSAITAAREPLPLGFVSKLLFSGKWSPALQRKVRKAIGCISSLLPVSDDRIHFFHKSVKDWLTDKSCYEQHSFSVEEEAGHFVLTSLCIEEYDDIKRRGVDSSKQFTDTAEYALQHGVQHMLQFDEGTRSCNLEELANKFVIDVELLYAKLCVNNSTAIVDMLSFTMEQALDALSSTAQSSLETLLTLLRKHGMSLNELPSTIFQTVLNEGGPELSSEASKLLKTKYSDLTYMEYLDKEDLQGAVQNEFYCSSQVACFDVSPQLDFMVCECRDGTIQLWSLLTGKLMWKRQVIKIKRYNEINDCWLLGSFRTFEIPRTSKSGLACFRSVVFHPNNEVILPGVLSQAYSLNGELDDLFPESNCSFSVCSISGDRILTDCPDDARCLVMWSLKDGREITRLTGEEDVLTFGWSRDGRLLAISYSSGSVCVVDAMNGFRTLVKTTTPKVCGMIKFSPDNLFLFCWHWEGSFDVGRGYGSWSSGCDNSVCFRLDVGNFSLSVSSDSCCFKPWEFESRSAVGFMLGDPLSCLNERSFDHTRDVKVSFDFVLSEQRVLRSHPRRYSITMLSLDNPGKDRDDRNSDIREQIDSVVFSLNGETLYTLSPKCFSPVQIKAWDVLSRKLKGEISKVFVSSHPFSAHCFFLEPVKEGILLGPCAGGRMWELNHPGILELWNFDLSDCIRRWNDITYFTTLSRISDECVLVEHRRPDRAIILDTTTGDIVTTISDFPGRIVAFSSKRQLITIHDGLLHSVQNPAWEKRLARFDEEAILFYRNVTGKFSPAGQFFVMVCSGHPQEVSVLDALSGSSLHVLCGAKNVRNKYEFVSDEECVIPVYNPSSGRNRLLLFNIRSGDLVSLIDGGKYPWHPLMASCPRKGLVAICPEHSNLKFTVIQVKNSKKTPQLPRESSINSDE